MATPFDPNQQDTQRFPQQPQYAPPYVAPKRPLYKRPAAWAIGVLGIVVISQAAALSADDSQSSVMGTVTPTIAVPPGNQPINPEECIGYGCSPEQDAQLNEEEAEANAAENMPAVNERGNIVKQLGQEGGIASSPDMTEPDAVRWTVDAITTDIDCTEPYYSYQPENGHIAAVDLRMTTGATFNDVTGGYASLSSYDFEFINEAGVTHTNLGTIATYSCLSESETFTSSQLGPARTYEGKVILDLPSTTGTLVFSPSWSDPYYTGNGGWEYPVG